MAHISSSLDMKILITGGAGYIGSIVSEYCIQAGDEVVVYDNLSTGHRESVHDDALFVRGDVGDRELAAATMKQQSIDAVIHMSGFIEAGESMRDPGRYFRNNTCRPLELLEAMVDAGVHRILFSSTAAVYGNPQTEILREDHPLNPTNAYGESKLQFERLLDWYERIYDIRHAALRYFNAAGATAARGEDHRPESHLIPLVLQTALGQRRSVTIFGTDYPTGDGTCIRDYVHVVDLAQAHIKALGSLVDQSLHYNLGNGRGYSVREVIDAARRVTGIDVAVEEAPRRPGDAAVLVAGAGRIAADLGWKPEHPTLEAIIASAWQWHRENPQGYG